MELRINLTKANKLDVEHELRMNGIDLEPCEFCNYAYYSSNTEEDIERLDCYKDGKIYLQNFSSMIPPIIMEPHPGENILDMCAAPGGKTTQMACLSNNGALITACERDKIRFQKLEYNVKKQNARVNLLRQDATTLNNALKFDKILLDAPCSGSGTHEPERYQSLRMASDVDPFNEYFFKDLRMEHKFGYLYKLNKMQKKLILKAINILKPGGILIYSTCSVLPEENDGIVKFALDTKKVKLEPIDINKYNINKLAMINSMEGTICIMPDKYFQGFYVAKLVKI
jgi:16S rRNA C967 or C1407 C5-methylase (RsmB/RsmF family)